MPNKLSTIARHLQERVALLRTEQADLDNDELLAALYEIESGSHELRSHLAVEPPDDPQWGYPVRFVAEEYEDGSPTRIQITNKGMTLDVQRGPRGEGEQRQKPNGTDVGRLIDATVLLLEYHQDTMPCDENARILAHLHAARDEVNRRALDRIERGVWGTMQP